MSASIIALDIIFNVTLSVKTTARRIRRMASAFLGCAMPKSQHFDPYESIVSQSDVVAQSALINIPFGMCKSSVKNVIVLRKRKTDRNGENKKFPMNVMSEIGIPQQAKIGNDAAVTMSCIFKKFRTNLKIGFSKIMRCFRLQAVF